MAPAYDSSFVDRRTRRIGVTDYCTIDFQVNCLFCHDASVGCFTTYDAIGFVRSSTSSELTETRISRQFHIFSPSFPTTPNERQLGGAVTLIFFFFSSLTFLSGPPRSKFVNLRAQITERNSPTHNSRNETKSGGFFLLLTQTQNDSSLSFFLLFLPLYLLFPSAALFSPRKKATTETRRSFHDTSKRDRRRLIELVLLA